MESSGTTGEYSFPRPPEYLPSWAVKAASEWQNLNDFDLQVKLEKLSGLQVEVVKTTMSPRLWGFTFTKRELGRSRIFINNGLPLFWQRFALFHEIHHMLHDSRGCYFWSLTNMPMTSFEFQADQFAWAVMMPEWESGDEWEFTQ